MVTIRLAFSTCPNDTFLFYALVKGKVSIPGIRFEVHLADILELNNIAKQGEADLVKVSCNALGYLFPNWYLLRTGSAMGKGCGPLLITHQDNTEDSWQSGIVAIPGKMTTANLLLSARWPELKQKKEVLFSDIIPAILSGEVQAGLLIHEQRFTYTQYPVRCVEDLGEWWENTTSLPIPLGAIVASRTLDPDLVRQLEWAIGESVRYAWQNIEEVMLYVSQYAQEMSTEVMKLHIDLYVNNFTENMGVSGAIALDRLLETGTEEGFYPEVPNVENDLWISNSKITQ